jgi:hypothetical protein
VPSGRLTLAAPEASPKQEVVCYTQLLGLLVHSQLLALCGLWGRRVRQWAYPTSTPCQLCSLAQMASCSSIQDHTQDREVPTPGMLSGLPGSSSGSS